MRCMNHRAEWNVITMWQSFLWEARDAEALMACLVRLDSQRKQALMAVPRVLQHAGLLQASLAALLDLKVALFQKVKDNFFVTQIAKIIIPFNYPKLLHPVHGIKKSIIYFDTFYVKKTLWL